MKELSLRSFSKYDTLIVGEAAGIDFERACEITKEAKICLICCFILSMLICALLLHTIKSI